jgi:putative peptidoglycan lipid II flippase
VGLSLVAEPLVQLLFERGEFTPADTLRAARMIACYSAGVWAFCALPVAVRGFYALGDHATPVKIGLAAVGLNLALALGLVWPLAEIGLAAATTAAAVLQLTLLVAALSRRAAAPQWKPLAGTALRSALAAAAMLAAGLATYSVVLPGLGLTGRLSRVGVPCCVCALAYFAVYALVGRRDLKALLGRGLTPA